MSGFRLRLRLVLFEPAGNIEHFGNVMAGAAANTMRLFGDTDKDGVHIQEFESLVKLFGFGNGSAIVGFTGHD